ncbi:hypothetical protein F5877DRAFT_86864, partial [Lentinula edodes]
SDTEKLEKWELKAEKAAGLIYLAVSPAQQVPIKAHQEDPIRMWSILEQQHVSKKPGARFNAYNALFTITKSADESLMDMAARVEAAMADIQNLRPSVAPIAVQSNGLPVPGFTLDSLDSELQSMALIRALPEEYKHLSSNLLLQDNLDKEKILAAFLAEQQNQEHAEQQSLNRAAQVATSSNKKKNSYRNPPRTGDPKDYCKWCGKKAVHWQEDCPSNPHNKRKGIQANKAKVTEVDDDGVTESAGSATASSLSNGLSASSFADTMQWNTDTGATSHMTPHRNWIRNYTPHRVPIRLADHTVVYSEGIGEVLFTPIVDGKEVRQVLFSRVLHVPSLNNNLLSVLYLTKHKGFTVQILRDTMEFTLNDSVLFTASVNNKSVGYLNGHTISIGTEDESAHIGGTTLPLNLELWHRRFFHYNYGDCKTRPSM